MIVFVMDALQACAPLVYQFNLVFHWKYIINIKEKGNKSLFKYFESRLERDLVQWINKEDENGQIVLVTPIIYPLMIVILL